jgi:hypothetical protein
MHKVKFLLASIIITLVSASFSFLVAGLWGLLIWSCLFTFALIEVVYYAGAKGSLLHGFGSTVSSNRPDTRIEASISSPRGWYDLDYRGRGKH